MKKEWKKPAVGAWLRRGLLAALALTAGVLWWMQGKQEEMPEPTPSPIPAPTVQRDERSVREAAYDHDVAALQALLESGAADAATQELAARKLTELIGEHQHEIALENALREAGYESAVVLMQNGAVTVMVPAERLNEASGAQILELCVVHAGVGRENVRVMGIEQ